MNYVQSPNSNPTEPIAEAKLCARCQAIFQGSRIPETPNRDEELERWPHHATAASMEEAAESGCLICDPAWRALVREYGREDLFSPPRYNPAASRWSVDTAMKWPPTFTHYTLCSDFMDLLPVTDDGRPDVRGALELGIRRTPVGTYNVGYTVNLFTSQDLGSSVPSNARPARTSDNSEKLKQMKAWIANCVAHHAECRDSPASARLYPTRLIDVGTKASPELRLRVSTEDAIDGPYATLSHCWGGLVPFRLLKDNMKDLRKRIEFQQLPKTFQDAITTARGIGVRYLWIDSLCIIQDSTDDWAAEAPQMTLVYGGSLVTFAATAAEDGTQGLFLDKSPPAIPYVKTSWTDAPNFTYGILRELLTRQHIDEGALNRRAWVFQERILSRRLIHFAGEQIFWQCYGRIACESLPSGLPEVYQRPSLTRRLILDPSDSGAQGGSTLLRSSAQPLRIWADMVREYSAKKLTYPGDRLMAISGIARLIQKTIKDEYMAGMWRRNLARELCWDSSAPVAQQRSLGRGPSWSWASLDGPIRFRYTAEYYEDDEKHSFPRKPVIEILHASVTLKGQDAYGQVESGSLHVRGSVYPVRPGSIGPSDYDLPGSDFNSWRCEDVGFETPYCAVDWDTGEDETLFTCGTTLYWLPVWFDAPRNPVFPNNVYLGGLLLRGPVPDGDGSFRRAGSFDVASIGVEAINVFLDPEFYSEWKRELVIS